MLEFRSKRLEKLTETPRYGGGKRNKSPFATSATATLERSGENPEALSESAVLLMERLQAGSQWLTAQHQAWLDDEKGAASDERFSAALDGWAEMERSLRLVYSYQGCIFGADQRCPQDAPVTCDGCLSPTTRVVYM